jgi:thimet oligopeptidase
MKSKLVLASCVFLLANPLQAKEKTPTYHYPTISSVKEIQHLYLHSPTEIVQKAKFLSQKFDESMEKFLKTKVQKTASNRMLQQWDHLFAELGGYMNLCNAMSLVEPKDDLRKAYLAAYGELRKKVIEVLCDNKEIYDFFLSLEKKETKQPTLNQEQRFFLTHLLQEMRLEGLHLDASKKEKLKQIKVALTQLSEQFAENIQQDKSALFATKGDLIGVDPNFLNQLPLDEKGLYRLGCDYPTYFTIMKTCENRLVRKELYRKFMNRAHPANEKVLLAMIAKRDELAHLLGFESYAHYQLSNEMVKDPKKALEFLDGMVASVNPKVLEELKELKESFPDLELTQEGKLYPWDVGFYQEKLLQSKYHVDDEAIKEYFPLESTIEGLIRIYEEFFDIRISNMSCQNLWHEDVKLLGIYAKEAKEPMGYILMDLYPRQNKYTHACHATVFSGLDTPFSPSTTSLSFLIANFPKPQKERPSLMSLSDARTFFHEFGHAIHAVMGRTSFASTAGTSVKVDFVELPSQMLEEWLWEPSILKMVSKHYLTKEPLSEELIENIIKTRKVGSAGFIARQCVLSKLSLEFFLAGQDKNLSELHKALHSSINLAYGYDTESHFHSSFGHLDEYGARYYGYLWSRVFALDLFSYIKERGLLSKDIGVRYAKEILRKGGGDEPERMIRSFLGRDPSSQAFLQAYGIL